MLEVARRDRNEGLLWSIGWSMYLWHDWCRVVLWLIARLLRRRPSISDASVSPVSGCLSGLLKAEGTLDRRLRLDPCEDSVSSIASCRYPRKSVPRGAEGGRKPSRDSSRAQEVHAKTARGIGGRAIFISIHSAENISCEEKVKNRGDLSTGSSYLRIWGNRGEETQGNIISDGVAGNFPAHSEFFEVGTPVVGRIFDLTTMEAGGRGSTLELRRQ